jgi:bacillithiol biosynthesis cysteine-adding enzyme BshC
VPKSISFHRLPGGNPLFIDYVENFDRLKSFFAHDYRLPPQQWDSLLRPSRRLSPNHDDLIAGLLADARRWESGRMAQKHIEALRDSNTLAVVTGQQVGLFGGPLYTYYKATSAILWAHAIQKATGRTTVPVFWMETSDHDFYEINHTRLLDLEGEEILLSLTNPPEQKRRVVGTLSLNGEVEKLVQRLWTLLPPSTYRGPILEMLAGCYQQGATFGDAFARLFSFLFREDGLIIFDAENARCKRAAAPLLQRCIAESPNLNEQLDEITEAVHLSGYPPQIQPQMDRLQLFAKVDNVRIPISAEGALLFEDRPAEAVGLKGLQERAAQNPEDFLPKVSLRPIMQDYLFPTVASIAGPAEVAYLAQLKPLYELLGVSMPVVIPRLSVTLIEAKMRRILEKYNFKPEELRLGSQAIINQLLEADPGSDLVGLFARGRGKWQEVKDELTVGLMAIDPTLEHPVEKTMEHWLQGLEVLEEKARAAVRRKNETLVSQVKRAVLNLAPGGNLQERRFGMPYFLARYGRALSQKIRTQAQIDLYRHQLIYLDDAK